MMLVAGAAEVINAFQVKSWGKIPAMASARRSLHRRRLRHV